MLALLLPALLLAPADRVVVKPTDNGAVLSNPQMGWVTHHYDNSLEAYGQPLGIGYTCEDFPGVTVCYLRLAWAFCEPQEGRFNWSVVDSVAQRYIASGRRIAFRFSCSETGLKFATPEWVKRAGAKGYFYEWGKGVRDDGPLWEPDFDDPIFLAKLDRFLAAAAARYDGDPHVAFIDVGSFGVWGEGHTQVKRYDPNVIRKHVDLYHKHFQHTLIAAQDDWPLRTHIAELQQPGQVRLPLVFMLPAPEADTTYEVNGGLWLPNDQTRPLARMLPDRGAADRRVRLGTLTVTKAGQTTFQPADTGAPTTQGDYHVTVGAFEQHGHRGYLATHWLVHRPLPAGTLPFAHLDLAGKMVGGGWAGGEPEAQMYARSLGFTLRDDSILVQGGVNRYFSDQMAQSFWPHVPVILESEHYGGSRDRRNWADGHGYLDAVEDYHASYVSIHWFPPEFLREQKPLIDRINRRLGYRLQLLEASWPAEATIDDELRFSSRWRNAGVAPCYPSPRPTYWLFNQRGELGAVFVDEGFDLRQLPVGRPDQAEPRARTTAFVAPPTLSAGNWEVRVSVGNRHGTPQIALPLDGDDGHRRYQLGTMTIVGEYGLVAGAPRTEGDAVLLPLTLTVRRALPAGTSLFCHADRDGRIAFQCGWQSPVGADAFGRPGPVTGVLKLTAPAAARGASYAIWCGLWKDGDTRPGGRMLPDAGAADRRVHLGTLTVAPDGALSFRAGQ